LFVFLLLLAFLLLVILVVARLGSGKWGKHNRRGITIRGEQFEIDKTK
jgi:hypothetical protein